MIEMCATPEDFRLAKDIIADYADEIYDIVDSGFPVHKDWAFKSQQVAQQYITLVSAMELIERQLETGQLRLCWMEGEFGS